jgi:hypothetical protein
MSTRSSKRAKTTAAAAAAAPMSGLSESDAWKALQKHHDSHGKTMNMRELFDKDKHRFEK